MTASCALIIDDEPDILELLDITLSRMGLTVHTASTVEGALNCLRNHHYDICFTDMRLPDGSGVSIVNHINQHSPDTPVAVITAYASAQSAVDALKAGAFDFVSKPVNLENLRNLVKQALRTKQKAPMPVEFSLQLLGVSAGIAEVKRKIAKLARSQAPVYISGESGVGKELAARLIHDSGSRHEGRFIPINCGAIPSELMESEFFGHKKGSFTGAHADKEGLFHAAHHGTLFLDEIADLPLQMQVKLLRVIQEKTVRPIGAKAETAIDVRILSATHKNLGQLVESGDFRQDLYYRINVIELAMPPLRERIDDIDGLIDYFLEKLALEWGINRPEVSQNALELLKGYPFPGNVRELENILERATTLCDNNVIQAEDLQLKINVNAVGSTENSNSQRLPLDEYMGSVERELIEKALQSAKFNKTAAAKKLGITFRALRYKLKKLGID